MTYTTAFSSTCLSAVQTRLRWSSTRASGTASTDAYANTTEVLGLVLMARTRKTLSVRAYFFYHISLPSHPLTFTLPRVFLDMRKPLSRDPYRRSVRPNGRDMIVSAHDVS